jgi:Adenylate and Guanylate cyclase catalytic domain
VLIIINLTAVFPFSGSELVCTVVLLRQASCVGSGRGSNCLEVSLCNRHMILSAQASPFPLTSNYSYTTTDTVNTAAFIEGTGERNRIHVSQETADLLATVGKGHWVEERGEKIHVKGKDELQTYWLIFRGSPSGQSRSSSSGADDTENGVDEKNHASSPTSLLNPFDSKTQRLVEWNTDVLSRLLKEVVASRLSRESYRVEGLPNDTAHGLAKDESMNVLDEVVEIIHLPDFDVQGVNRRVDASNMELSDKVKQQLRDFVTIIASMYRYLWRIGC